MTDVRQIYRVAAAMAVSNYGHLGLTIPVSRVTDWRVPTNKAYASPESEVCDIAGSIMETDEHEAMFGEEAASWAETISKYQTLEEFAEAFPHHREWILTIANMEMPNG